MDLLSRAGISAAGHRGGIGREGPCGMPGDFRVSPFTRLSVPSRNDFPGHHRPIWSLLVRSRTGHTNEGPEIVVARRNVGPLSNGLEEIAVTLGLKAGGDRLRSPMRRWDLAADTTRKGGMPGLGGRICVVLAAVLVVVAAIAASPRSAPRPAAFMTGSVAEEHGLVADGAAALAQPVATQAPILPAAMSAPRAAGTVGPGSRGALVITVHLKADPANNLPETVPTTPLPRCPPASSTPRVHGFNRPRTECSAGSSRSAGTRDRADHHDPVHSRVADRDRQAGRRRHPPARTQHRSEPGQRRHLLLRRGRGVRGPQL